MRSIALATIALLAACSTQTPEPIIRTVEIRVPVDDPRCAREALARLRSEQPDFPDTDQALRNAESAFRGTQLLLAGRLLRIARLAAFEDAMEACARGG